MTGQKIGRLGTHEMRKLEGEAFLKKSRHVFCPFDMVDNCLSLIISG